MPRPHRLVVLVAAVACLLAVACAGPSQARTQGHAASSRLPSEATWKADVKKAMRGGQAYLDGRAAEGPAKLAINLDVDNTMIATQYDPDHAVRPVLNFVRHARSLGIAVLVNTARRPSRAAETRRELRAAGYRIDGLCLHTPGTSIPGGKQACRRRFAHEGYTIVANVGNRSTDFAGGGYERAFKLPSYHRQLG